MAAERDKDNLSEDMRQFLQEIELEAEIQAIIDAAIEIGINDYTREDAIQTILEQERSSDDRGQG